MFFSKFPILSARIGRTNVLIEDFFARVVPGSQYNKLTSVLSPYFVGDGQRIEDVAFELYGDMELHWIIILCNNIIDPYKEWPVADSVLTKQLFTKYNFTVGVPVGHGLVVGSTIQSSRGDFFRVVEVHQESVIINSRGKTSYLSREDFLYRSGLPIPIASVDDPLSSIHHYEDVETGYQVDFDVDKAAMGIIASVSNIDYEYRLNDAKRTIRVLDKKYLSDFIQVFEREMDK